MGGRRQRRDGHAPTPGAAGGEAPAASRGPRPTAPVPLPLALLQVVVAALVPAVLWWLVGEPVVQIGAILLLLVAHERVGGAWARRHPGDAVAAVVPALRADLLVPLGIASAVVAGLLLLEFGLGVEVAEALGPFTPVAPTLIGIREITLRMRRERARRLSGGAPRR